MNNISYANFSRYFKGCLIAVRALNSSYVRNRILCSYFLLKAQTNNLMSTVQTQQLLTNEYYVLPENNEFVVRRKSRVRGLSWHRCFCTFENDKGLLQSFKVDKYRKVIKPFDFVPWEPEIQRNLMTVRCYQHAFNIGLHQ